MKKNTWIKPEFEVETFVPNNYIASGCSFTTLDYTSGYIINDTGEIGRWEGTFNLKDNSDEGELSGSEDNTFFGGFPLPRLLTSPGETIDPPGTFNTAPVIFAPNESTFIPCTAVTMDIEGEKEWVYLTRQKINGS